MAFLRIALTAFLQALAAPRVVLFAWLGITIAAVSVVLPAWLAADDALTQHPGASFLADQALDADLRRTEPAMTLQLSGAWLFALFLFLWLSGGVLTCVGRGERRAFGIFLRSGSGLFFRNLRVVAIGLVPAALVFWALEALVAWLEQGWLADADPGAVLVPLWIWDLRLAHLLFFGDLLRGFVFLLVAFGAKVAMAELALQDKNSASLAWLRALGRMVRRPLRITLVLSTLVATWMLGSYFIGMGTAWALEVRHNLWLGLSFGQLGILWSVVAVFAMLLTARHFAEPDVDGLPALPKPTD